MILSKKKYSILDPDLLIKQRVKEGRLSSFLIIVPTNRKVRALKKEIVDLAGGRAAGKINIETLNTFSSKLYTAIADLPIQILSEAASAVLMKKSFNSVPLNYFNRYKAEVPPGTLDRIKNIISEYKRHGLTPEHIFKEAEKLALSEKLKAQDIAVLYSFYNDECKRTNSGETGDVYSELLQFTREKFLKAFQSEFSMVDLVLVEGFDEFTAPEAEIIDRISSIGCELLISYDYDEKNPGLFLHQRESFERFTSKGFYKSGLIKENRNVFRGILKSEFFSGNAPSEKISFNITELAALDKQKEVELISKEIKELITHDNVEPDRICVVFNLIQDYSAVIRDKFAEYRLPFNLTDRISLSSSGPVTAIISFLEILENDFYNKNIFRALSSGFISIKNVSLSELIKTSSELKILSGYRNWKETLEEGIRTGRKRDIPAYNSALQSIEAILGLLSPLNIQMTIPQFRKKLFGLIENLRIPENILNSGMDTAVYFKALAAFYEVLSELFNLLINEYGSDKLCNLSFYLDEIRTAADNSRFNVTEKSGYGIQVTNLDEIRGLNYDYLFIGGLIDGGLPTRYSPEIFHSGSFRKEEWKHQAEERFRFYQSLCCWEKGLYLSRPLQDETRELVPSNFLSELKNLFLIKQKTEKDFSETIYSRIELQDYAGQKICDAVSSEEQKSALGDLGEIDIAEVVRMMEIFRHRKGNLTETEFNGYILSTLSETAAELLNKVKDKDFSISQLEIYAKCPFRYFLERVLNVKVIEEPEEEMESREFGGLVHDILYRFYKQAVEEKIILRNCSDEVFSKAEEIMYTSAADVIEEKAGKSPLNFLEIEKIMGINGDRKKSVLHKFLEAERESQECFLPYDFEVNFGNMPDDANGKIAGGKEIIAGSTRVRGKIDRIDINEKEGTLRVSDYKTGAQKPSLDDIEEGLSLQLPLYLHAAKQILLEKKKKEFLPAAADLYSLKYQSDTFGRKPVLNEKKFQGDELYDEYERLIAVCIEKIDQYTDGISNGRFNLTTLEKREEKACKFCSFESVCRVNEIL